MDEEVLRTRYDEIHAEATLLAGDLLNIPRRAVILQSLYLDSRRNHTFPLLAAHGALWAYGYFEIGGSLGRLIAQRYFYNREERAYRLSLLHEFAEAFRRVNRQVCIDTYTNYYFTRNYGNLPGAEKIVPAPVLDALNRVHRARAAGQELTAAERRKVFEQSFRGEQEVTVAPGVAAAMDSFECRIMKTLCMKPLVRFSYFPGGTLFWFRDFASTQERIEKGMRAFDLAHRAGWDRAAHSLRDYGVMPLALLNDPMQSFAALREETARTATVGTAMPGTTR